MAFQRYLIDGYGQLEINNCAFRRDGRIEAQCFLDPADFADESMEKASVPCENGMVLAVDKARHMVRFPVANETLPLAINFSAEHMYDERANGLKDHKIEWRKDGEYFLPRMGYLAVGDLFTTNCFGYDSEKFADDEELEEAAKNMFADEDPTGRLYAAPSEEGAWVISNARAASGCAAEVVKAFTMPDGTFALQLRILAL